MNVDKEPKSDKMGMRGGTDTKIVCQTVSVEIKYKNVTIYTMLSMWYNQHFEICKEHLNINPTTLILSSLEREF